jgi:hypothetical protein
MWQPPQAWAILASIEFPAQVGQMSICLRRREFVAGLGAAAVPGAWPLAARAQRALPVVGYVRAAGENPERERVFRQGLGEAGYTEGRNVTVEHHILDGSSTAVAPIFLGISRG